MLCMYELTQLVFVLQLELSILYVIHVCAVLKHIFYDKL